MMAESRKRIEYRWRRLFRDFGALPATIELAIRTDRRRRQAKAARIARRNNR